MVPSPYGVPPYPYAMPGHYQAPGMPHYYNPYGKQAPPAAGAGGYPMGYAAPPGHAPPVPHSHPPAPYGAVFPPAAAYSTPYPPAYAPPPGDNSDYAAYAQRTMAAR